LAKSVTPGQSILVADGSLVLTVKVRKSCWRFDIRFGIFEARAREKSIITHIDTLHFGW
jgi:hypothetical protein